MKHSFFIFLALMFAGFLPRSAHAQSPLPVELAFQVSVARTSPDRAVLTWVVAPGHHLYRDQFQVSVVDGSASSTVAISLPEGVWRDDPDMGKTQVFSSPGHVDFSLPKDSSVISLRYQGCADAGMCYPPQEKTIKLDPELKVEQGTVSVAADNAPETSDFSFSLLVLAFLGGLVLNILPCVLPVLAIKAAAFLTPKHSQQARRGLLFYSLGVLLSFVILGGVLAWVRPSDAGWGFQLQSSWFVGVLTVVFLLMGAALMDWVRLPSFASGRISALVSMRGLSGDFFAGVLAVIVASPCVGPFLGSALAVAFLVPPAQALLIFIAMGVGLAFPALLLAAFPRTASFLPKPGAWMETFKKVLSLPLLLAALWLAWVLSRLTSNGVAASVVAAVCLFLFFIRVMAGNSQRRPLMMGAAAAAVSLVAVLVAAPFRADEKTPVMLSSDAFTPPPTVMVGPYGSQPFTPDRLEVLRSQGRIVFVSIGADWCITCKANEATVLSKPEFTKALASKNAVWLVGDWTRKNPQIAAFLKSRNAVGVPLYLVFRPDGVRQLPQILTQEEIAKALI